MKNALTFVAISLVATSVAFAQTASTTSTPPKAAEKDRKEVLKDFDDLGGNGVLLEKARALNPDATVRVVQNRLVDRRKRFEFASEFSDVLGGDPYVKTETVGLNLHYHFNPHISAGLKYAYAFNQLSPEGDSLINDRQINNAAVIPDSFDYLKSEYMALVNWYPLYGKMNFMDLGIAHFDVYGIGGLGLVDLKSGSHATYTGGLGVGFWFREHYTLRTEVRYQSYNQNTYAGERQLQTTLLSLQAGYLL